MTATVTVAAGPLRPDAVVLAVPVRPGGDGPVAGAGSDVVVALGVDVAAVLAARKAKGEPGEVVDVPVARGGVDTVLLVGVGDGTPPALRKAAAAMVRRAAAAHTPCTSACLAR